jgi:pimeloyl-ACP methyl ester carboxylesterase
MLATALERLPTGPVRVARLGAGPPLLLLHGYPDTLQIWSALAPRLAARFEVIALDWPGMGESPAWPGGATPFHMADRLVALLDAWRIDRAVLVGADMGGQPALVAAARHPRRVAALVVMNSLVLWDEATSWDIALLRRLGFNRAILRHLPRVVLARAERTSLPPGVRLAADVGADFRRSFGRREVRDYVVRMCAGYQASLPRLPDLYARVAGPTLVLWGGRDRHFPPAHAERLHRLVPGSRLELIEGAEHWMAWYRAGEVADRILAFREGA